MSLDVYLRMPGATKPAGSGIFIRDEGQTVEITREEWDRRFPGREPVVAPSLEESDEVYSANITHNLNKMAGAADLYEYLWRPDEIGVTHAKQLVTPLRNGLARLQADPAKFEAFNPPNKWGSYEGLVRFVEQYLAACEEYPDAQVSVSR
jgi:hypothetical protein